MNPTTVVHGCPRCHADLTYDLFGRPPAWTCAGGCGYSRPHLIENKSVKWTEQHRSAFKAPKESMVTTVNGVTPSGALEPDLVSLPELGQQWNTTAAGAKRMLDSRGIPTELIDGRIYVRRGKIDDLELSNRKTSKPAPKPTTPKPTYEMTVGESHSVEVVTKQLKAGKVSLAIDVKLTELTVEERTWLFDLIDRVKEA